MRDEALAQRVRAFVEQEGDQHLLVELHRCSALVAPTYDYVASWRTAASAVLLPTFEQAAVDARKLEPAIYRFSFRTQQGALLGSEHIEVTPA